MWANTTTSRGIVTNELGFTSVCFGRLIHTGDNDDDEPYIQASQAQMVYYVDDEFDKNWCIPVHIKPRDGVHGLNLERSVNQICDQHISKITEAKNERGFEESVPIPNTVTVYVQKCRLLNLLGKQPMNAPRDFTRLLSRFSRSTPRLAVSIKKETKHHTQQSTWGHIVNHPPATQSAAPQVQSSPSLSAPQVQSTCAPTPIPSSNDFFFSS
ncbi:hypothetical protein V8G54_020005 [Vigna mungo]|uniref:DUF4216 domain-containing protein n=1 Tax=Vigna mungo TaxID=3915 RepID=A0AAQ3NB37_VIGMU